MSDTSEGDTSEVDKRLQEAFNQLAQEGVRQMRALAVSMRTGGSLGHFRRGEEARAITALADFTQEERDDLHRWARWLLGFDPEDG